MYLPYRRLPTVASLAPRRHIVALAAKRSPKRLKYSTPRFTKVDPSGVDAWKLQPVIELLKQLAVGVIPTDTVYAIACDCKNHSAVERLRRMKKIESSKVRDMPALSIFPLICTSFLLKALDFVVDRGERVAEPFTIVEMYLQTLSWIVVEDYESHLWEDTLSLLALKTLVG